MKYTAFQAFSSLFFSDSHILKVWDINALHSCLQQSFAVIDERDTIEAYLGAIGLFPSILTPEELVDERGLAPNNIVLSWVLKCAETEDKTILFIQLISMQEGKACLCINNQQGERFWIPLPINYQAVEIQSALYKLQSYLNRRIVLFPSGRLVAYFRQITPPCDVDVYLQVYPPVLHDKDLFPKRTTSASMLSSHLKRLESESIHILREAVAEADNPAMLYSIGKDSGVMLHLARKAFYPATPPFPLLHVDTRWKFQEMYLFRDYMAKQSGMELLVYTNPEAIEKNINPFDHGSSLHTDITKTEGLKKALDYYKFDVVFGGARRDEEKSRAKERVFSFRSSTHRWDPKS